jgi:tetratricopeptide (TPR) repeat protein
MKLGILASDTDLRMYNEANIMLQRNNYFEAFSQFSTLLTLLNERRNKPLDLIARIERKIKKIQDPIAYKAEKRQSQLISKYRELSEIYISNADKLFKSENYKEAAEGYGKLINIYSLLEEKGHFVPAKDKADAYWNRALSLDHFSESISFKSNKKMLIEEVLRLCNQALGLYRNHKDRKLCTAVIAGCEKFIEEQRLTKFEIFISLMLSGEEVDEFNQVSSLIENREDLEMSFDGSSKSEASDEEDSEITVVPARIPPTLTFMKEALPIEHIAEPEASNGQKKRKVRSELESLEFFGWEKKAKKLN